MPRSVKIVLVAIATAGILSVGLAVGAGVALVRGGMIVVRVHEKTPGGANVHIVLPGAAARAAIAFVPDRAFHCAGHDMHRWLPAMQAAIAELETMPDATLVEVEDGRETVHVRVENGTLVIDADTPQESVHVSLPGGVASAVAWRLGRLAKAPARASL